MRAYDNAFFGLRIDIPDTWELVSSKHAKISRPWRALYQARDDDLPVRGGGPRFLFTANGCAPASAAVVEASIELSVFRLAPGEDLHDTMVANMRREGRQSGREGRWAIGGVEFGFVEQSVKTSGGTGAIRFAYSRFQDALWLYAKIAGYRQDSFAEAVRIFQGGSWQGTGGA
jgi:hypothetical protein